MKREISTLTLLENLKTIEHEGDNYTNCDWCFGTVTKGLLKDLEDLEVSLVETMQSTALLKTAKILRRVQETRGDLLSLNLP